MRKLKLELEELSVESFETAGEAEERGTVRGNSFPTRFAQCITNACSGADGVTCDETCGYTCYATCGETCGANSCDGCITYTCDC